MSTGMQPRSSVDEEALIAEYDAEKPARHLAGLPGQLVAVLAVAVSLLALWWVFSPIPAQRYRPLFLGAVLALTFLVYRGWGRSRAAREGDAPDNPTAVDWLLAAATLVPFAYVVLDAERFFRRSVSPGELDVLVGSAILLLTLEGARRTVGWIVPAIVGVFLLYAYLGPLVPAPFNTASFPWPAIIGREVMSTGGIFSEPLAVAASYLILFTLYGAVLEYTGAARFFLDVSFAAFGQSNAGPGRTVTLAGFLLGTVSGSGVATTVTLGGVSWPILRRAGYPKEEAGGVLAAAGIGAILSPPTLGAAAFLIAEILRVSYLEVLLWATIPTLLYYLGIVLAIEMDARRYRTRAVKVETPPLGHLLLRYGYHFSSLVAIVVFLAMGMTAFRAVVLATALAVALSFLDREHWMTPRRAWDALAAGARGVLPVASVMAAAGLIVGVMGLTGLAAKLASIIVTLAAGNLAITALLSAFAVLLLGLAVPVTASFIIAYAVIRPALTQLGVPQEAAAMFVFYYAVLSEVSPPTALSPFAAAAITGGRPLRTMLLTWKYTLPAFLVPFIFVLAPAGSGLLLQGEWTTILSAFVAAAVGVGGLAVATGAWLLGPAGWPERVLFGAGGVVMLVLSPIFVGIGAALMAAGAVVHLLARRRAATGPA
ncbi:MAG TPA: TRAP transporter fused permease subunit [Candidatus Limnocylindria bacterium]|nr:TRAP transporter fused permease subunit [Candidatus Limnocylindria bacterium]